MMRTLLILSLVLTAQIANALNLPPTNKEAAYLSFKNKLINPGFENGSSSWTNTGAVFTITTAAADIGEGLRSASWDASATNQTLMSSNYTIERGLRATNGLAQCRYRTTATDILMQVWDGTNVVREQTLPASSVYALTPALNFVFPSSGTVRIRYVSQSNSDALFLDDCYLGAAFNIANVAQSSLVVSAFKAGTANCSWEVTSSSYADFPADADCPAITVDAQSGIGSVVTTDDDRPQIVINNLPPGTYKVTATFSGTYLSGSKLLCYRLSDGTTGRAEQCTQVDGIITSNYSLVGTFSYTTAGNRTFKIQGLSSATENRIFNDAASRRLQFIVERLPTTPEIVASISTLPWYVDVNIGGANPSLGTAAVSTYTGITNASLDLVTNAGSIPAQIPCSGTNPSTGATCASGSESVGVVFDLPTAGAVEACIYGSVQHYWANSLTFATFQLVETPNAAQTILSEGNSRVTTGNQDPDLGAANTPFNHCSIFNFTSSGQKTIRLFYEMDVAGPGAVTAPIILAGRSANQGQNDIRITVKPVTQNLPIPVFVGGVSSNANSALRIESARITCSSSSSVNNTTSTGWISVSNISGNRCNLTFSGFASAPNCTANVMSTETGVARVTHLNIASATSGSIGCTVAPSTNCIGPDVFEMLCIGPR